jgi:hypothetical protein
MSEKCHDCPVAGRCVVDWTGHTTFCGWASSGDPARVARVVAMSRQAPPDAPDVDPLFALARAATEGTSPPTLPPGTSCCG